MAPPRRRTRSTGMSPGAMGGKIGSPVTSKPKPSTMSPGERKARTGFTAPKQDLAKQFFKGPVSDDRLRRRLQQSQEEAAFKRGLTIAPGTTNLYQEQAPTFNPITGQYERTTLAQKRQQLANLYGPTPREVLSDIGYGIRSIAGGLGQKFAAGELGIMGLAKRLYEQFTNKANQAKDFLGKQVDKLSDIDLEILKNKDKYKLTSQKPDIQFLNQLESNAKLAAENRDLFGSYATFGGSSIPGTVKQETLEPIIPSTLYGLPQQPPGFKVMTPEQKALLEEIKQSDVARTNQNNIQIKDGQANTISDQQMNDAINKSNEIFGEDSILGTSATYDPNKSYLQQQDDYYYQGRPQYSPTGNQYLYADASQQDIDRINKMRQLKGMDPQSIYDMKDIFQLSPELTLEDIQGIKEGTITQPTGVFAAEGGMIDKKLDSLQKKTNNIYGTGILSVR